MHKQARQLYEFGPFSIDTAERLLLRDGQPIPLTPKAFDLLLALVESGGHLLEKDELMERLWPTTFVEEANLSNNISLLRKALGVESGDRQFIETVPKRGYRFVAPVGKTLSRSPELVIEEGAETTVTLEEELICLDQQPAPKQIGRHASNYRWLAAGALAAVLALAGVVYHFWPRKPEPLQPVRSIAVLPFKPLVADNRDESLEMGITETLITRLSGIKDVGVRSMGSVRKYNALDQDPIVAGREQRVDAVLDGNIQKTGDRVRLWARLIRVNDGHTLWADKFDERLADIFALQDSISEKVTAAMAVKLTGKERQLLTRHYTDNTEAYQLYLTGRMLRTQWLEDSIQKALECYDRAIAIDPNYALAYTGKADVYSANSSVFLLPAVAIPKAREAAQKALEIDDQLAEAHLSMAQVKLYGDWDFAGAEEEFKQAISLKPSDAEIHGFYGNILMIQKRNEESFLELARALELDPVSLAVNHRIAFVLYFAGQYEQALERYQKALALYPNSDGLHRGIGCVFRQKGMYQDAVRELQKAIDLLRTDNNISELGHACAVSGKREEARKLANGLEELSKHRYVSPVRIAKIYAGLREREQAFKWLQRAYDDRCDHLLGLAVDPAFDGIRSDPRFLDLLRRVGLQL